MLNSFTSTQKHSFFTQLIWSSANNSSTRTNQNYEGALDLREIKEVSSSDINFSYFLFCTNLLGLIVQ